MAEEQTAPLPLHIDIVSDVVCPWCVIGFKRLEQVLADNAGRFTVDISWHPFELNPRMPPEGQNLREHLVQKAGITPEQSRTARARLTELGESLGFTFRFRDEMRIGNTFRAHQLLHWAGEHGLQTELKLRLFSTYFAEDGWIDDPDTLVSAAVAVGLDGETAAAVLADQRFADTVRSAERQWVEQGVQAVPAFVFNGRAAVLGAQEAAQFQRALDKAA